MKTGLLLICFIVVVVQGTDLYAFDRIQKQTLVENVFSVTEFHYPNPEGCPPNFITASLAYSDHIMDFMWDCEQMHGAVDIYGVYPYTNPLTPLCCIPTQDDPPFNLYTFLSTPAICVFDEEK
jgi:hypothetical protein